MRSTLFAVPLLLLSAGCATIMGGGSSQPVTVQATPAGATFVIKSSSGLQLASGAAPQTVRLPRKNEYQIDFTAPGFQTQTIALTRGTNGWVFGNLVVGWIVGFIVDFASGSAYKLEPSVVSITMVQHAAVDGSLQTSAKVVLLDDHGHPVRETEVPLIPVEQGR